MKTRTRQQTRRSRPPATRRAALYARVSTDDKGQDLEIRLGQLRDYAARRGFAVAGEFVDSAIARELGIGYGTAWTCVKAMEP